MSNSEAYLKARGWKLFRKAIDGKKPIWVSPYRGLLLSQRDAMREERQRERAHLLRTLEMPKIPPEVFEYAEALRIDAMRATAYQAKHHSLTQNRKRGEKKIDSPTD